MDLNKNYYALLNITHETTLDDIKKSYYKLCKKYHPDVNSISDSNIFCDIIEAYDILSGNLRDEYDLKSKFGKNYDEYFELFDINIDYDFNKENNKRNGFKRDEIVDIYINIDDTFNGTLEYERWVKCKVCDGTGKDLSSKIIIRDNDGNIIKMFDADDGCDFCFGIGKDQYGMDCSFCQGAGKIGLTPCKKCNGEKRILGKQKISGIKLSGKETKIDSMGNCSKNITGLVGNLYLITN